MSVLERADAHLAESIHHVSRATAAMADAIDDGIAVAKRVGKHGSDAAEEFLDDTRERIKRHPAGTVMMVFGAGFLIGGFVSWLVNRR